MDRKQLIGYTIIATTLALLLPITATLAGEPLAACNLYTKADAEALFQQTVSDGVTRKTMLPAGHSCRYTYTVNGDSYSLQLRVSTNADITEEGINESTSDLMQRQEATRKNKAYAAKKFHQIQNLGTDAFWGGEDLWVLQDDTLLIISIHSFLKGSFKTMDEGHQAHEEQDKELSLQVAKSVLLKLR
jgi:hypothetical protein